MVKRLIIVLAGMVVVAFLADLGYSGMGLYSSLRSARDHLSSARTAFDAGDIGTAQAYVAAAQRDASKATDLAHRPAIATAALIPGLGNDAKDLRSIAKVAGLSSAAAEDILRTASTLGVRGNRVPSSLYSNGTVNFDAIASAAPRAAAAQAKLAQAQQILATSPSALLSPVNNALTRARSQVAEVRGTVDSAHALLSTLPGLLGADGPRKYLLAFQALGEARGTGGVIGLYGILNADSGHIRLGHVGPFTDFQPHPLAKPVSAPGWFAQNYSSQFSLRQWQQANLSPNFPAVGQVLANQYTAGTGQALNGVIAMDPIALQDLLKVTGPIRSPASSVEVTGDNAARVIMKDSYERFPNPRDQNAFLGGLVSSFWDQVDAGAFSGRQFVKAFTNAVTTQHLKMFAADPQEEAALTELHADGGYEWTGRNVQLVFTDNYAVNKVDYYLHRSVDTTVRLAASGDAEVTTKVKLTNDAPSGPPSLLLGTGSHGVPPGTNKTLLNVLMPTGAKVTKVSLDDHREAKLQYSDAGHLVAWDVVTVPPGGTSELSVTYAVPRAAAFDAAGGSFAFDLFPQASVNPDAFSLKVWGPPGFRVGASGSRVAAPDEPYQSQGTLDSDRDFSIRFVP